MSSPPRKAIFLTSENPFPPNGGGKLRDVQLLNLLAEKLEVEILCFGRDSPQPAHPGFPGLKLTMIPRDRAPIWKRAVYPFRPYIVNGRSRNLENALKERAGSNSTLWISRLGMGQYISFAKELGYTVILDEHNVESAVLMDAAFSRVSRWPTSLIAAQCTYYEIQFCRGADRVVATSQHDAHRLKKLTGVTPLVLPNTVDVPSYESARQVQGHTLFFSGTLNYEPNVEGLKWFVSKVLPKLKASLGSSLPKIVVAGSRPSPEFIRLLRQAGIGVEVGPESMLPFLKEAAVVIVPLITGSGTRLKILEAMAAGKPVVSTGKGVEGLELIPGVDYLRADHSDDFVSAILRLLRDGELQKKISAHALETVAKSYDWRCHRSTMAGLLE